jgi:hypothetical protein
LLGSVYFNVNLTTISTTMAEAAQAVPTFKLVLVGDGGTGKVRSISLVDALLLLATVLGLSLPSFLHGWRILDLDR